MIVDASVCLKKLNGFVMVCLIYQIVLETAVDLYLGFFRVFFLYSDFCCSVYFALEHSRWQHSSVSHTANKEAGSGFNQRRKVCQLCVVVVVFYHFL